MKKMSVVLALVAVVAMLALLAGTTLGANNQAEEMMVEVSITNLTGGQVMSPVFVARHGSGADSLYSLGESASGGSGQDGRRCRRQRSVRGMGPTKQRARQRSDGGEPERGADSTG